MKHLLRYLVLCIPLSACYQNDVTSIEAKIDYPPLAAQNAIDNLKLQPMAGFSDIADAKNVMIAVLSRLMNVIEIANVEADVVAEGSSPDPLLKSMAREFIIIEATSGRCLNSVAEDVNVDENAKKEVNTESLVWDDADNNKVSSVGDEWFYIWEGCENASNGSVLTGVMSFTGMPDPLNQLGSHVDLTSFTNYQYSFDLQIDGLNSKSVFLKNTKLVFSRDDDEIATLKILPGSVMGVKSAENLYLFDFNSATFVSDDASETLTLNIDARYFDSTDQLAGYVDVVSTEDLVFETVRIDGRLNATRLASGVLELLAKEDQKVKLVLDEDETNVTFSFDIKDGASETVEQAAIFENGKIPVVNITGDPS